MKERPGLTPVWLGTIDYERCLAWQRARRDAIVGGLDYSGQSMCVERSGEQAFWLLQHPRVVTVGRREVGDGVDLRQLTSRGVRVVRTERGGLATWHGPGQLVGYLLVALPELGLGVRQLVAAIEAGLIAWLHGEGIAAHTRAGLRGVWVGDAKIAAIGLHVRRGVTMHGFALNLAGSLADFDMITPCGLANVRVTSAMQLTGRSFAPAGVWSPVGQHVWRAIVDTAARGR